jgi:hypothetical protein
MSEQTEEMTQGATQGGGVAATALKAAAAAAAAGAAAIAAKKAFSGGGEDPNGASHENGGKVSNGAQRATAMGSGTLGSIASGGLDAARDALLPALEDAAGAAGAYLAENGPEILRDRIVPRFVESFNEAHST